MIRQVNAEQKIIEYWTFGGGTAMMLQIDHRISHDVDIFLADPQVLPFLDPQNHDFNFEIRPADYKGDGARLLKLGFEFGQIDFIVAPSLTSSPAMQATVEGEMVLLETIPEIIAKKIYHRGASIAPRDILTSRRPANCTRNPSSGSWPAIAIASQERWSQSTD